MKIFATILLAIACVQANSIARYGWAPETESLFRFESQVLTGIPDIDKSHYAGIKLMANVRVQAANDYTLRVKLEQPRFMTLNGEISLTQAYRVIGNGGPRANAKEHLSQQFRKFLEEPMLVHLKKGLVQSFFVARDEPVAVTNIKRSLLAQLQLDISGSQVSETESNMIGSGAPAEVKIPFYSVLEGSLHGKCRTMYNVNPLTNARAIELEQLWEKEELQAQLTPSAEGKAACEGKKYFEIIKTRDYDACKSSPAYQAASGIDLNIDVTRTNAGNVMTHMTSTIATVCGELSTFNIRKIVVEDSVITNPIGANTKQTLRSTSRMNIELIKTQRVSSRIPMPAQTREETSLVYAYTEEAALRSQLSPEVVQKTQQVLRVDPVLPQPGLTEAPKSINIAPLTRTEIVAKTVEQIRIHAKEMAEAPESCTANHDISGKLLSLAKYMQVLGLNDVEQIWTKSIAGTAGATLDITKNMLLDTIAMVGSNPTTMFVLKKIEAKEFHAAKSAMAIQSALRSIKTPTKELLQQFVKLVRQLKNTNDDKQTQLLTATLLQLSNVFYKAYVNPTTMIANYPVRMYGIFGTKDSSVLVQEYIPLLKEMLMATKQSQNKQMEMVVIAALGKLGHHDAAKLVIEVAQGLRQEKPMVRALAVYQLKRVSKRFPMAMKPVVLAIIDNPSEHADVRVAALSLLPWTRPTYAELQRVAVRSWFETSRQVSAFAHSLFKSLQYTEVPELKSIGVKARGIMHLFKPAHYGIDFSKHFDLSNFVHYLQGAVTSKLAFANSKYELAPSKLAMSFNIYVQALGSGLNIETGSFEAYSQGVHRVFDHIFKLVSDINQMDPHVKAELVKVVNELNLETRVPKEYMTFVQTRVMGYEAAALITKDNVMNALEQISSIVGAGAYARQYVAVTNLVSVEFYGMNEAGFPAFVEIDNPSVLAASVYMKLESSSAYKLTAAIRPLWNAKIQSNFGIVSPITEEIISTGVTAAMHAALPIEAIASLRKGEVDIVLKTPEATLRKGDNLETIHAFVLPYTARKDIRSVSPINKSADLKKILTGHQIKRTDRHFSGLINGEFKAESDNKFVDFASYWSKIQQHNVPSLLTVGLIPSSVKMSSARLTINPKMGELKEIVLKLKLWAQHANWLIAKVAKPFGQEVLQKIESNKLESIRKALVLLKGAPATVVEVEASLKGNSVLKTVIAYAAFGAKTASEQYAKTAAAVNVKLPQEPMAYGILYKGEVEMPTMKARWNKDLIAQQPMELNWNAELDYGFEGRRQSQIKLNTKLSKTHEQIRSVLASPEFKKCAEVARAGRPLSPICSKARQQAGSLDRAEVTLRLPQNVFASPILMSVEQMLKGLFAAHYRPIMSRPIIPSGEIKMQFDVARTGDVAQAMVMHKNDAYKLENIRIPYLVQGVFPACARNNVFDWLLQKATVNMHPASCRIEPEHVTTFDKMTYAYKINDCEHVLFLDASRSFPAAVLAKTVAGQNKKMVTILAGNYKAEIIPASGALKLKVNGALKAIRPDQVVYLKNTQTGANDMEIKRYRDGVYYVHAPALMLRVITNGENIEVVSSPLLRNRAAGLCGDLNGEVVADIPSPRKCIMTPRMAAMSYMLNKEGRQGSAFPKCAGIPTNAQAEYKRQEQTCMKETIVPTSIVPIFEQTRRLSQTPWTCNACQVVFSLDQCQVMGACVQPTMAGVAGGVSGIGSPYGAESGMGQGYGSSSYGAESGMGEGYGSGSYGAESGMGHGYERPSPMDSGMGGNGYTSGMGGMGGMGGNSGNAGGRGGYEMESRRPMGSSGMRGFRIGSGMGGGSGSSPSNGRQGRPSF